MSVKVYGKKMVKRKRYIKSSKPVTKLVKKAVAAAGETKFWTEYLTGFGLLAGQFSQLAQLTQGYANGQRIGIKVQPMSLSFKYSVQTTDAAPQACRVIIFRYRDDYTTPPAITTLLVNDTGGANPSYNAPYNLVNKDKYKILHDKIFVMNGYNVAAGNYQTINAIKRVSKTINLKNHPIRWKDDIGTHYEDGAIYLACMTTSANLKVVDFGSIIKYKDL